MCYMGVNRLNLRSLDDDSRVKVTFVKLRGIPSPRMFVCDSNNMAATCCWFTTTNIYQEHSFTWDMLDIDDRLVNLNDPLPEIPDQFIKERILTSVINKRKIEAIKLYRELTGLGLKESKDRIDEIETQMVFKNPVTGTQHV